MVGHSTVSLRDNRHTMAGDRPILGILLIIGFCALAPMGDAIAKLLGGTMPVGQLLLVRFGVQAVMLIPIVWLTGQSLRMTRRVFVLTVVRTVLHLTGVGAMFTALRYMPLADTLAIAFVMPFIMLVLGKLFLSEEVGARRIGACIVGFGGSLLVIQPSFEDVGAPALLPLLVALTFALFMMVTRQIAKETDAVTLQLVSGAVATVMMIGLLLAASGTALATEGGAFPPPLTLIEPDMRDAVLLVSVGVLGTLAHLLMTWSLRFAPSATLAPVQYLEIPVATLIGWIIFSDLPDGLALAGIIVTVGAGLYIVLRERNLARLVPPEA
jgi:drug/metabolite transporter (DMT)-like permease